MAERLSLRERIGGWVLGDEANTIRQMRRIADQFEEASRYELVASTQLASTRMSELDPRLVDLFRTLTNYEVIGSYGTDSFSVEQLRRSAITEANLMYDQDVISQYMVNLWTDFGFGLSLEVVPRDEDAQEVWSEFWESDRNSVVLGEREIHALSTNLLNDGEVFFSITTSTLDGECTVRTVPASEMTEIIYDPEDGTTPIFYKRDFTPTDPDYPNIIYYPDWRASEEDRRRVARTLTLDNRTVLADTVRANTAVGMVAAQHRKRYGRGWPLLKTGFSWNRVYKSFLQDRAAIERAAAAYLDKLKGKSGSRGIDAIRQALESTLATSAGEYEERNPPPAAGATWIENDAIERTRLSQGTGATDAETDGQMILAQVGLAGSIYPHYLGRGEAFRLATATSMETPIFRAFNRYRNFWSSVWRDITRYVLQMAVEYGDYAPFEDMDVDIAQDPIISQSTDAVNAVGTLIQKASEQGLIDPTVAELATEQVLKTALAMLGIRNVDDILNPPEELLPEEPEEPALPPEEETPPEEVPPEELPPEEEAPPFGEAELAEMEEWLKTEGPFEFTLISESEDKYFRALRGLTAGLWRGAISQFEFIDGMVSVISYYMTQAWNRGAAVYGIKPEDLTQDEVEAREEMINEQYSHTVNLSEWIMSQNRESGTLLGSLMPRLQLWAERYNDAYTRGLVMAKADQKLMWKLNQLRDVKENCPSCQKLHGKVKRASYWNEKGILPHTPGVAYLKCKGWKCGCDLVRTNEPVSRGPLPNLP